MSIPGWLHAARDQWSNRGDERPSFADEPDPGQESAWDYPRPPWSYRTGGPSRSTTMPGG